MQISKAFSLIIISICYLITFPLSSYITSNYPQFHYILDLLFWDFIESTLLFGFAFASNSISIIDLYWKLAPLFQISAIAIHRFQEGNFCLKHMISYSLLVLWAIRLLYNYLRSWPGLNFLDFRVHYYQKKCGKLLFWPMAYIIFFIVSGSILYLAKLPLLSFLIDSDNVFRWHIIIGWVFMLVGILCETFADNQLYNFRKSKKSGMICDEGLWFYCRHPNYFGELLFWWGAFVTGIEILAKYQWFFIGPVIINSMFALGSGPWMDEHLSEKRKNYGDYMKVNTSLIIPWFRTQKFLKTE